MHCCDVLVVGGGLAGLTCAERLATAGLDTLLIEQKRQLGARIHTTGIFVRKTLESFALPEELLGPPIRDVVLYSPARRRLPLSSPRDEFRVGHMGALYRHLRAAAEAAGARVITGARFVGAGSDTVTIERDGHALRIGCRFVIGADGARSRVARAFALDVNQSFLIGAEDVLPSTGPARPVMHCFLDPDLAPGYLAWLADDGCEAHLGVAGTGTGYRPLAALARLRAELGIREQRRERRGGRIPVGGLLARIASRRALLVGDAAGAVSPLTAGGLDPCLRQAELACQVVTRWLRSGDPAVLEAYQSPVLRARFRGRRYLRATFDRLRSRTGVELAFRALATRPLTSVAERVFFGRGSFPDVDLDRMLAGRSPGGWLPLPVGTATRSL